VSKQAMVILSGSCRVISCLIHIRSLHTKGWAKRKQITIREALALQPHFCTRGTCWAVNWLSNCNTGSNSTSPPQQTV